MARTPFRLFLGIEPRETKNFSSRLNGLRLIFMTRKLSVLAPLSQLYGGAVARRRRRFLEKPVVQLENCAVISVGNITVGGTGKTPAVQYIARLLQKSGVHVAVVARGYGGTLAKRGAIVSDGKRILHAAREVGDEPLLHARALPGVPVVVGIDRVRAAQLALEKFAPEVIVLDDAFQFYSLHRDLDIVLLDARRPLGNGHLLPRGTLREEAAALHRADILLLTRADRATPQQLAATQETLRAFSDAPICEAEHASVKLLRVNFENMPRENAAREYSRRESTNVKMARDENAPSVSAASRKASREYSPKKDAAARGGKEDLAPMANAPIANARSENRAGRNGEYSLDWLSGKTVGAASALADNNGFRATLETLGARVVAHCARRDHHKWRDAEIVAAARESKARGASALIVTEKDAVKISRDATQKSALPVLSLGIELRVTHGENELRDLLTQAASTRSLRDKVSKQDAENLPTTNVPSASIKKLR